MMKWEIVRFSARGIGLNLPPGRLYLVEGLFDAAGIVELGGAAEDALAPAQDCDM